MSSEERKTIRENTTPLAPENIPDGQIRKSANQKTNIYIIKLLAAEKHLPFPGRGG